MDDERTHYDVVGVDPSASKAEVRSAYQQALNSAHAHGDVEEEARIRRAWQVLSDPVQRQRYDEQIGVGLRGGSDAAGDTTDDDATGDEGDVEVVDELAPGPVDERMLVAGAPAFLEQPTIGRRLTASLIDVVTLLAGFLASITITYAVTGADSGLPGVITVIGWTEFWILVLFVVPTWRTGQTVGKRLTYVMTVDRSTGMLPSATQVLRRYIVPMVAIPALFQMGAFLALFFGLSYAMGRDQLSLADRLARTIVVVARYKPTRSADAS